jgi:hypothetical protein
LTPTSTLVLSSHQKFHHIFVGVILVDRYSSPAENDSFLSFSRYASRYGRVPLLVFRLLHSYYAQTVKIRHWTHQTTLHTVRMSTYRYIHTGTYVARLRDPRSRAETAYLRYICQRNMVPFAGHTPLLTQAIFLSIQLPRCPELRIAPNY